MQYRKSAIGLKSHDWSSVELLKGLSRFDIKCTEELIEEKRSNLWHDMSSEFDSKHFLNFIFTKTELQPSDNFVEFACLWHLDEQNHYRGLRQINSVLYGISETDIDARMNSRTPNFASISHFLNDEFSILISIAFDEYTSTRAYQQDFPVFDQFGPDCLSAWIRNAARDEATHYGNAIKILKKNHQHRFAEVEEFIARLIIHETSEDFRYENTFILDHDTDDFSLSMFEESRNAITRSLRGDK